ncbi:MAG: hypothetical protein JWR83_589 [Aeromicrobium sp.]|nr:hypothetical protein [Aeromicrobium sp.]
MIRQFPCGIARAGLSSVAIVVATWPAQPVDVDELLGRGSASDWATATSNE